MHAFQTDDLRISAIAPLISPAVLIYELPVAEQTASVVSRGRQDCEAILSGNDDRVLVVVGPCSIHDPKAALDYAARLAKLAEKYAKDLCIVMRVYFEKPRTTVGWKGLINDPKLDNSFDINRGLRSARQLLIDVANMGLPCATEFLDTITPQYIADLISWGAIGARTTESQIHRELASGLSMPVGFKNGTTGSVQIAIDAIVSSSCPHNFLSVTKQGVSAIVSTTGNSCCHLILRGSSQGVNYDAASIQSAVQALEKANLAPYVMVDCSHGNSLKDYRNQPKVVADLCAQLAGGSTAIAAVMIESNIEAGAQSLQPGVELVYGKSITDQCIDWADTEKVLAELATAVQARRKQQA